MNPGAERPSAGVLGLGIIGSRVGRRLRDAGFPLAVWNRTRRSFDGLPEPENSPADVAAKADILQVFVSDDAALHGTVQALMPALTPRHVILCHATVSPHTVQELAEQVGARGAALLDAPFTGSRDAATIGQITYYVAGDGDAIERARPVLEASAKALIPTGRVGRASTVKIATNIMAAAAAVSLAEAVNLLRANGVDPAILADVLETNAARSGVTDLKLPCLLNSDFAPRFSARNMRKDLRLARELAADGQDALTAAMLDLYDRACREGYGDEDFAAVAKVGSPASPPAGA
ncbi:MAG: NAD(P)-dependent oxidoreductase [Chthoniobacterales bacterium]|nr:NAD(P)-dependent oxidoreductase [Chthoniobacterales bacterium]